MDIKSKLTDEQITLIENKPFKHLAYAVMTKAAECGMWLPVSDFTLALERDLGPLVDVGLIKSESARRGDWVKIAGNHVYYLRNDGGLEHNRVNNSYRRSKDLESSLSPFYLESIEKINEIIDLLYDRKANPSLLTNNPNPLIEEKEMRPIKKSHITARSVMKALFITKAKAAIVNNNNLYRITGIKPSIKKEMAPLMPYFAGQGSCEGSLSTVDRDFEIQGIIKRGVNPETYEKIPHGDTGWHQLLDVEEYYKRTKNHDEIIEEYRRVKKEIDNLNNNDEQALQFANDCFAETIQPLIDGKNQKTINEQLDMIEDQRIEIVDLRSQILEADDQIRKMEEQIQLLKNSPGQSEKAKDQDREIKEQATTIEDQKHEIEDLQAQLAVIQDQLANANSKTANGYISHLTHCREDEFHREIGKIASKRSKIEQIK